MHDQISSNQNGVKRTFSEELGGALDLGTNQNVLARQKSGGRKAVPPEVRLATGQRLLSLRKRLDLTQEQVADAGGFKRELMSKFERGDNLSSRANLEALAIGLGVDEVLLRDLVDGAVTVEQVLSGAGEKSASPVVVDEQRLARLIDLARKMDPPAGAEDIHRASQAAASTGRATDEELVKLLRGKEVKASKEIRGPAVTDLDDLRGGIGDAHAVFAKANAREKVPQTDEELDAEKPSKIQPRRKR